MHRKRLLLCRNQLQCFLYRRDNPWQRKADKKIVFDKIHPAMFTSRWLKKISDPNGA